MSAKQSRRRRPERGEAAQQVRQRAIGIRQYRDTRGEALIAESDDGEAAGMAKTFVAPPPAERVRARPTAPEAEAERYERANARIPARGHVARVALDRRA